MLCKWLSPAALQLYTTKDAGDAGEEHAPDPHSPTLTRTLKKLVMDPVKSVTAKRSSPPLPPVPAGSGGSSRDGEGSAGAQLQPPGSVDSAAQDLEEDQVCVIHLLCYARSCGGWWREGSSSPVLSLASMWCACQPPA